MRQVRSAGAAGAGAASTRHNRSKIRWNLANGWNSLVLEEKNLLLSSLYNSLSLSLSMQHASLSADTHPRRVIPNVVSFPKI